jgi:DNA polymerase-1
MPKFCERTAFGKYRMYPNLMQTRVPTGRYNAKDPNLLAIPTRTERGRQIRDGFITDDGWCIVTGDESQIEPRVAAHRSKDRNLCRIYENEEDIYSDFATAAFRLEDKRYKSTGEELAKRLAKGDSPWVYPTVDRDKHRRPAKTCVLAALYDVTASGLLNQMPVVCKNCNLPADKHTCSKFQSYWTEDNCQDLINSFYMRYPGLMEMRKRDHKRMMKYAYIWCDWGRIIHTAAVRSIHPWVVSTALREGANAPIQATAAGTFKISGAQFFDDLETGGLLEVCHPLLPIHDEYLLECREDVADEIQQLLCYRFENCVKLSVDIKASGAKAQTWGKLPK